MKTARLLCMTALCSMALAVSSAAQSIPWRTRVRVVTDSGTIDGRIESVDSLNLRVRVKDDYVSVRRSAVSSVLRHGTLGEKGVKMGAIGGAVIGGVMIGGLAGGMCEGDNCGQDALLGAAVGGVVGMLGGAAIGGLIGSTFTRWTQMPARFEVHYVNGRGR